MLIKDFKTILYNMKGRVITAEYLSTVNSNKRLRKYSVSAELVTGMYIPLLEGETIADFEKYLADINLDDSFFVDAKGKFYVDKDKVCALCFDITYS